MKKVTINGKEYAVLFNANSLFEFTELTNFSLDKLVTVQSEAGGQGLAFSQARLLIWCGIKEATLEMGEPFTMTPRDVGKLFDPIDKNIKYLAEFMDIFIHSKGMPDVGDKEDLNKKK